MILGPLALAVAAALAAPPALGRQSPPAPPRRPPATDVVYRPPVSRPVSRPFDMSAGEYGAGNRGLDYAVSPGDAVVAIGRGTVVFAGPVAGVVWVTVLHPDGLRSSSGPMASLAVQPGRAVEAGTTLGTTGATFHLGVRSGTRYVDPAPLFGRRRHARLVPTRHRTSRPHVVTGYTFDPTWPGRPRAPSSPRARGGRLPRSGRIPGR